MDKKHFYSLNIAIFFVIVLSFLLVTNWLCQVYFASYFKLKLFILDFVFTWKFLFRGSGYEILFNCLIGPAYLFIFYSCRKNRFLYSYILVIFLTLLLVYHSYTVCGFNVILPVDKLRFISPVNKDLIPLHFIPYFIQAIPLVCLYLYLFFQARKKIHTIKFSFNGLNFKYAPYVLIITTYVLVFFLASKP